MAGLTPLSEILTDAVLSAVLRSERRERGLCVDCGGALGRGYADSFCARCLETIRTNDPGLYRYITQQHARR
jgi:hypothetical protein